MDTEQEISVHHSFYVPATQDPNTVYDLTDLIVRCDTTLSSMPYDEIALIKIIAAKVEAEQAAIRAVNAAAIAEGAIQETQDNAAATAEDRVAVSGMKDL